jgi:hypothetical protein
MTGRYSLLCRWALPHPVAQDRNDARSDQDGELSEHSPQGSVTQHTVKNREAVPQRAQDGADHDQETGRSLVHASEPTVNPAERIYGRMPSMLPPVGSVVTDTGLTFSLAPVNPLTVPLRLRCTSCPWQATVAGPDEIREQSDRHALAHEINPEPFIAHLPAWLQWWKGRI